MGLKCRISYSASGQATVTDANGNASKLFADALAVTQDQNAALNIWASAYTPEFQETFGTTSQTEEPPVLQVVKYYQSLKQLDGRLEPKELFEVRQMMRTTGISNLSDFSSTLKAIFLQGDVPGIDENLAIESGLFLPEDLNSIDLPKVVDLIARMEGETLSNDFEVEPQDSEILYRDTAHKNIFGASETVTIEQIDSEVIDLIDNFQSEEEFYDKLQELPYSDFTARFYEDEAFANEYMAKFQGLVKVPVIEERAGELVSDVTPTFSTVKNTILDGLDSITIDADISFINSIADNIWEVNAETVSSVVQEIEAELATKNIDIIGLHSITTDKATLLEMLNAASVMVENPTDTNILAFSQVYDKTFLRQPAKKVVKISGNLQGLTLVSMYSAKTDQQLFDQHGLIKVGDNLYHKVDLTADISEAYEYLYQQMREGAFQIPYQYRTETNMDNKPAVLQDIAEFVNARETGLGFYNEKASLYQVVFGHPEINLVKESDMATSALSTLTTNEVYLKTDFVSDFYSMILQEKLADSPVYRNTLSKFSVTDNDITLTSDLVSDLTDIPMYQELMDYIKLRKNSSMKKFLPAEMMGDTNEAFSAYNFPTTIAQYTGTKAETQNLVVTPPILDDFIRIEDTVYQKVKVSETANVFLRLKPNNNSAYYTTTPPFANFTQEQIDRAAQTDMVTNTKLTGKDITARKEKSGVLSRLVNNIKARSASLVSKAQQQATKAFETNLVEFLRQKGLPVVTDLAEMKAALAELGIDSVNQMFRFEDIGVKPTVSIDFNGNKLTVTPSSSSKIKTPQQAYGVANSIFQKVRKYVQDTTGPLFRENMVVREGTTVTLNIPADMQERVEQMRSVEEEIARIINEQKQENSLEDYNPAQAELDRGVSPDVLKDLGYNMLQTPAGTILGFEYKGAIYLDPTLLNNVTTLHELTHVFQALVKVRANAGDTQAQKILQKREEVFGAMAREWEVFHKTLGAEPNFTRPLSESSVENLFSTTSRDLLENQEQESQGGDFVEAIPGVIYRGTSLENKTKTGFYTPNKTEADAYGEGGKTLKMILNPNAKILNILTGNYNRYDINEEAVAEYEKLTKSKYPLEGVSESLWGNTKERKALIDAGYDAVIAGTIDGYAVVVLTNKAITEYSDEKILAQYKRDKAEGLLTPLTKSLEKLASKLNPAKTFNALMVGIDGGYNLNSPEGATTVVGLLNMAKKLEQVYGIQKTDWVEAQTEKGLISRRRVTNRILKDKTLVLTKEDKAGIEQMTASEERVRNILLRIKYRTGWSRGADGQWRYEIEDKDAKVNLNLLKQNTGFFAEDITLEEVLDHPELYKAYPRLKNVSVNVWNDIDYSDANYSRYDNTISINVASLPESEIKAKLLHEVQHAIQNLEGFATVGAVEMAQMSMAGQIPGLSREGYDTIEEAAYEGVRSIAQLVEEGKTIADILEGNYSEFFFGSNPQTLVEYYISENTELRDIFTRAKDASQEVQTDLADIIVSNLSETLDTKPAFDLYLNNISEVEARNVEARLKLTPEERKNSLLQDTEDVDRDEQITIENGAGKTVVGGYGLFQTVTGFSPLQPGEVAPQFQFIGEGNRLTNNDRAALTLAKQLEADNKTPEEIYQKTNWLKTNQGIWIREIGDLKVIPPTEKELNTEVKNILRNREVVYEVEDLFDTSEIGNRYNFNNLKIKVTYERSEKNQTISFASINSKGERSITTLIKGSEDYLRRYLGGENIGEIVINRRGPRGTDRITAVQSFQSIINHEFQHILQAQDNTRKIGNSFNEVVKFFIRKNISAFPDIKSISRDEVLNRLERIYQKEDFAKYAETLYRNSIGERQATEVELRMFDKSTLPENFEGAFNIDTQDVQNGTASFQANEELRDTLGLDLSAPVYAQRQGESDTDYHNRLVNEVEAYVAAPEIAQKLEELRQTNPGLWSRITDFLKNLTTWLKTQIGLSDYDGDIMNMTKEEYTSALGVSILKEEYDDLFVPNNSNKIANEVINATVVLDSQVEMISLQTEEVQDALYNKIDNCG